MKHDHHNHCAHTQLRYCQKCDAAYCVSCNEEWPKIRYNWSYPINTYTSPTIPLTVTNGVNTTSTAGTNPLHYQHS